MKACPFCAEEIQDAAIVCKHCGRDLAPVQSTKAEPQKGRAAAVGCLGILVLFLLMAWCAGQFAPPPSRSTTPTSSATPTASPPPTSNTPAPGLEPQLELLSARGYWEYSYHHVTGTVKNVSGESLANVTAVTTWYDDAGNAIKTADALIDFNPILPGQTSPFSTITTSNPEMKRYTIDFKLLMGGTLRVKDSRTPPKTKRR